MTSDITSSPITEDLGTVFVPASSADAAQLPPAEDVVSAFKRSGVVLFRGFDIDHENFVSFTESMSSDFMDYSGGAYARDAIGGNKTVLSVTGNRQFFAVPFHGEMFYTKHRPTILWFYCVSPPQSGGETTVCDGVALLQRLSPETRELFARQDIVYIRHYDTESWHGIYQTEDLERVAAVCAERDTALSFDESDGSITTEFHCPATTRTLYTGETAFVNNILSVVAQEAAGHTHSLVRFADGSRIPEAVIEEIRTISDELTLAVDWKTHDLIMVDNSRLMHGRNKLNDLDREINVRMSGTVF